MLLGEGCKDTVLIVDDQKEAGDALAMLLGSEYETTTCLRGDEAIKVALQQPPSLILLDIEMPGIDGFETLSRMRAYSSLRDIPIIFISALDDACNESLGIQIGACDYLTKPVNIDVLRARIHHHLRDAATLRNLRHLSYTDPLTGLLNRRAIEERLDTEWRGAQRGNYDVSVLMLDIDRFGRYNNRYGHQRGDQCLRSVSATLQSGQRRKTDFAGRFGGEEFLLVLPYTSYEDACRLARSLLADIQGLQIPHGSNRPYSVVTASIGVASYHPQSGIKTCDGQQQQSTLHKLLQQADSKLYQAKSQGRNQVAA